MTYIAEIKDIPYDKKRADVVLSDGEICRAFKATIKEYGLVEENDRIIQLTRKGSFFADEVSELFYSPNFIPFDKTLYNAGRLNPYMVSHNV